MSEPIILSLIRKENNHYIIDTTFDEWIDWLSWGQFFGDEQPELPSCRTYQYVDELGAL